MSWLSNLKLKTKLLSAFCLCALITVVIGVLGQTGISRLYDLFQNTVEDNLVSIAKVDSVKANVIATNRDFYKALALSATKASPDEINAAIQSLKENQAQAESEFKVYRGTPLEADEKAAGDDFERDWAAYLSAVQSTLAMLQSGDIEQASKQAASSVTPSYRKTMAELKIIIESNARQARESAQAGVETDRQVSWMLGIGALLAVLCAIALGLIVTRMITRPIFLSVDSAARVASGDLTQTIASGGEDETGQLLKALSNMQGNLKNTVQQIANASDQLASAAEELTAVTDDSSRGLQRQNDEIQQAATAVNEMTAAVEEVARNAASASQVSTRTAEEAAKGQHQVQQAVAAMNTMTVEINDSTQRVEALAGQIRDITKVLDVIRGIAEQTNLLALNAAIEAARAGEQGRGFAVVADEVRALAARTQASTGEIESMISQVRNGADEAVHAMGKSQALAVNTQGLATEAGQALERISEGVSQINERNLVIASAAEEQAQVAREVDRNLVNIQDLSAQTAAGANQTNASSQELSRLAISFNSMVGKFTL
ncbi:MULTISPECIES: methyl-accepting chemotaxis protein [unclassified Pseudomonas]|uniref:methyl-accepting chemotaxis protein n=1 Tax=unclassified Pseudomonas TaxID=196821 RepID=UPI000D38333A|nr:MULTISPECIES: methyl-accepting chemotaxis protein [unclassified Pseudomonas]RAU45824.1 methyl-accepting chemotaxis protein [Pseudomonas sp. RIT 409]RAU56077.1 methyl-accepting chemotaxis protein [Pseudomonas sp. RIT 412]